MSSFFLSFRGVGWDWVYLVRRPLIGLLYQPRMIDDECGAVGEIWIGRGNRSMRKKSAPVPLRPSQIPHDLTWVRTRAAASAVGSRRLTAWTMARPYVIIRKLVDFLLNLQWDQDFCCARLPTQVMTCPQRSFIPSECLFIFQIESARYKPLFW
jgi:hypothetical protein